MKRAFSLVELSIVLVILGLLVGGVLSGQSLIRAAELRSVTTDFNRIFATMGTFRDKYFALPGDMANAASFWGAADGSTGSTAACLSAVSTGTNTCNGNGNGMIDAATSSYEYIRLWQHLANAGLIEGHYDGNFAYPFIPGQTIMKSRLGNAGYYVTWAPAVVASTSTFNLSAGHYVLLMTPSPSTDNVTAGALPLTPTDAWNIDTKMDDGMPGTGILIGFKGNSASTTYCTSAAGVVSDAGAVYQLSNTRKDCSVQLEHAF